MSSSWMDDDDHLQLCKSWCAISEDPTVGTGQKSKTFWGSIADHFNSNKQQGKQDRTARTLETKWSSVKHDVSKFIGCYSQVEDLQESGTNKDDMLEKAKNLYFDNSIDSKGKRHQFKYIECWRFMKDKPKWKAYRDKSTPKKPSNKKIIKIGTNDEENNDMLNNSPGDRRPPGIKCSKRQKRLDAKDSREEQDFAMSTMQMAKAIQAKANAQALTANLKLFTTSLEGLSNSARQFIELQQKMVLDQLKEANAKASAREDNESVVSTALNQSQDHSRSVINDESDVDDLDLSSNGN